MYKAAKSAFFPEKFDNDCVLFVCMFVFFPGVIISQQWSYSLVRGLIKTEIKSSKGWLLLFCSKNHPKKGQNTIEWKLKIVNRPRIIDKVGIKKYKVRVLPE